MTAWDRHLPTFKGALKRRILTYGKKHTLNWNLNENIEREAGAENNQKKMPAQENCNSQGPVAGVFLEHSNETITIYQAYKKRLLTPGTCLALLEAQAATGGIIDPVKNRICTVDDAVKEGIVGREMKEKLQFAERAITGYTDPYTNQQISLFQAMQKDVIPKEYGIRLLEAQISGKGIYDPIEKCYLTEEQANGRGHYDKDLFRDKMDDLRIFYDPNSQQNLTYPSLIKKCTVAPDTGLLLFPMYITFKGLRRGVTSAELLASKIIDQQTFENLHDGKTTTQEVMLMETVKEYLEGQTSIGE
ncbi:plectin [Pimephales promelas]|nr:plectin [Pimephales promelas]